MAQCRPGAGAPGSGQDPGGVLERARAGQPVPGRHPHLVQGDVGLPHRAQRHLSLDDLRLVARRALLHDERVDLAVLGTAGPDDDQVGDGAEPDPPFAAVQHPSPAFTIALHRAGRGFQGDRVRAVLRLGQREGPQLAHPGHVRQPARLLLLRAAHRDRQHGQARVHAEEHAEAAVTAVQFHRDQPARHRAHPGAPVSLDVLADDAELGQPPDQRPADLGPLPVRAGGRHHLLVDEPPDGDEARPLLVGELLADREEIRPEGFPEMLASGLGHRRLLPGRGTPPRPQRCSRGRRPAQGGRRGRCAAGCAVSAGA